MHKDWRSSLLLYSTVVRDSPEFSTVSNSRDKPVTSNLVPRIFSLFNKAILKSEKTLGTRLGDQFIEESGQEG